MTEVVSSSADRRKFLYIATTAFAGVGAAFGVWPLIDQLNPSADTRALATIKVNISAVKVGESITVLWRGQPAFIRHRTPTEIAEARSTPIRELKDPATDESRTIRAEWLIVVGICPHLGCIPTGYKGPFGGWSCPCHYSYYDTSGRIRTGPSPKNLIVPPYEFLEEGLVLIG
jgi:ubiquinol-cytochrome c reductase iron-sulfur subunit